MPLCSSTSRSSSCLYSFTSKNSCSILFCPFSSSILIFINTDNLHLHANILSLFSGPVPPSFTSHYEIHLLFPTIKKKTKGLFSSSHEVIRYIPIIAEFKLLYLCTIFFYFVIDLTSLQTVAVRCLLC